MTNERLGIIKQTPRQASIDDIEWLCEEVERLMTQIEILQRANRFLSEQIPTATA